MISAYLMGSQILDNPALKLMGLQALDYLCKNGVHANGCMYHSFLNGHAGLPGQLADHVWMTRALLDAYDLQKRKPYLHLAIALMHFACQELLDEQNGLFYDYPEHPQAEGRLALREQPLVENALAAECLLRMSLYSKRHNLRDTGLLVLSSCLEKYRRTGIQGAAYASVVIKAIENNWLFQ